MEQISVETDTDLQFRNGNPGAVQYGNFINYYKFHPPENRIKLLPKDIWTETDPFIVLDIGCNAGDLTLLLYKFLLDNVHSNCYVLGIDIDQVLIERAQEKNAEKNIQFLCVDFMNANDRANVLNFLLKYNATRFNATFCFSITMWIHLNHGDLGLKTFLKDACQISSMVIIEPQPWKCYKTAVKRMHLAKNSFVYFKQLQITKDVEFQIEKFLLKLEGVLKVYETDRTQWGRKILFFTVK